MRNVPFRLKNTGYGGFRALSEGHRNDGQKAVARVPEGRKESPMSDFTIAHIAQLHEIQAARRKRNQPGIGLEVENLIRQLTSGGVAGKSDDIRTAQAKRLWDLGIGHRYVDHFVGLRHGFRSFEDYLAAIPEIPAELLKHDSEFWLLVLVEPRIGLKRLCNLGGITFDGDGATFVEYDRRHYEFLYPTWIRIQDGRKNQNRSVRDCRKSFGKRELGLTALQGVCAYLQHPQVVSEATTESAHIMDLSGSAHRDNPDAAAFLKVWSGQPNLQWGRDGDALPYYGSASRRER